MSSLPLTQKLSEGSLFSQLNIPLSSKWPEIKKAYERRSKELSAQTKDANNTTNRIESEQQLKRLQTSYEIFSQRLSEENSKIHQTKEALKSFDLPETADWDKVEKRFDEIRKSKPELASELHPQLDVLQKNKTYLEPNPLLGKRTLLTAALVLGAAGISWAAYSYLDTEEIAGMFQEITANSESAQPESISAEGVIPKNMEEVSNEPLQFLDDAQLEQYILENTSFEDEILSLLGMLPSPELSLTLQYKMQVFSSLVKSV